MSGADDFLAALDFQREYDAEPWEIFRCCLLRTLMSFDGRPAEDGGADALPDLASAPPEISADGLVWTFSIREGIHYSPPLQDVQVVAADFVRVLQREANSSIMTGGYSPTGGYPEYYSVIQGFDDVREGRATGISGLETPDDHTLIVRLTQPSGELGYRFAMPATAPIPADPTDPLAPYGIATGHDHNEGRFLVGTGPYMIEGTGDLDLTRPATGQTPVAGFVPGTSLTLVRNPSWDAASDPLRAAYSDRMEFSISPAAVDDHMQEKLQEKWVYDTESGKTDMVFDTFQQVPDKDVARYRNDPTLVPYLHVDTQDWIRSLPMNVAAPPFDDIHVRRAANFVIDKRAIQRRASIDSIATHIGLDSEEGSLLLGFDPYPHDLARARHEMALSQYDHQGDGRCDDLSCRSVKACLPPDFANPIQKDLHTIGIDLDLGVDCMTSPPTNPASHVALTQLGWGTDYPDGSQILDQLFSGANIPDSGNFHLSLLGASPTQLRGWGYTVTQVPSVDGDINHCGTLVGNLQEQCWAELDQRLMLKVVPWVPLLTNNVARIVSSRVTSWSFDAFARMPALDRISIADATDP
jgi:peptide/nickel transport system substrate-binding protein